MHDPADTRGAYESLAAVYWPVALAVFAIVALLLAVIAVRFRASRRSEPSRRTSNLTLEAAYGVVLALVVATLTWQSYKAIAAVDPVVAQAAAAPQAGPAGLTVGIVASRWNWRFTYPGGVSQTGNGVEQVGQLVVPAGEPVRFRLTSLDVAHAFWVPALRAKYDALPGYTNIFDLQFDPGRDYTTARCSEFCGEYHDQMRFGVRVLSPARFRAWLRERQAAPPAEREQAG